MRVCAQHRVGIARGHLGVVLGPARESPLLIMFLGWVPSLLPPSSSQTQLGNLGLDTSTQAGPPGHVCSYAHARSHAQLHTYMHTHMGTTSHHAGTLSWCGRRLSCPLHLL